MKLAYNSRNYWIYYPLILVWSIMTFFQIYGLYRTKTTLKQHQEILVEIDKYNSTYKGKSDYSIHFQYLGKERQAGVCRTTLEDQNEEGKVMLFYNKRVDYFLDPRFNPAKITIEYIFTFLLLAGEIYLLYKLVSEMHKS